MSSPSWNIPRHTFDDMALSGAHDYVGRGEAVIVSGTTNSAPWSRCLPIAALEDYFTTTTNDDNWVVGQLEAQNAPAEVSMQAVGDIQNAMEYPLDDLTGKSAVELLLSRQQQKQCQTKPVLYVKVPLGGSCPKLLESLDLPSFLHRRGSDGHPHQFSAVSHPIHLRPSTYFCWAYIGEKGTGSKTHVDVLMSDAWLVVLTGRKRWAMVHPMDKHLVLDPQSGKFADLFNIDHDAFPHAHKARLCIFEQHAGDAVFVPSEAPHCVENLEFSTSITYNFCAPNTQHRWCCAMNRVMVATTSAASSSASAPPPTITKRTGIVDILLFNRSLSKRVTLRGFVEELPCLPTTDYEMRVMCLKQVQQAFRVYGVLFEGLKKHVNGVPIGCYSSPSDHRIVIHYEMLRSVDFTALFQEDHGHLFCVEDDDAMGSTCMKPGLVFPTLSSHFGPIPSYPPLPTLMWITPYTPSVSEPIFPTTTLASELSKYDNLRDALEEASGAEHEQHKHSLWHYSRFPWQGDDGVPRNSCWSCRTFLFYSSPDVHGPVCLHPLHEDGTLQTVNDLEGAVLSSKVSIGDISPNATAAFDPHFEEFQSTLSNNYSINDDTQQPAISLYNLSTDLIQQIACTLFLTKEVDGLLERAEAHGLRTLPTSSSSTGDDATTTTTTTNTTNTPSLSYDAQYKHIFDIGLEKLMVLALWFSCQVGVVGFTYSHTFSAVEEPGTVCLTGSTADSILRRVVSSTKAIALTKMCNLIDPPTDTPPSMRDVMMVSAKLDAVFDGSIPRVNVKRIVDLKKNATGITCGVADGGGESTETDEEDVAKRDQWISWWTAIDAAL